MELILMRHGKAEPAIPPMKDEERDLTEPGREKVIAAAQGLAGGLADASRLQIWTSSLARALSTASIVAEVLGVEELRLLPCLEEGKLPELLQELATVEEDAQVLVVGHEPYLSLWTEHLAGSALPFKPATAACLTPCAGRSERWRLRLYAQAGILGCLGKK